MNKLNQLIYHAGKLINGLTTVASYVKKEHGEEIVRRLNGAAKLADALRVVLPSLLPDNPVTASWVKNALAEYDGAQPASDAPMIVRTLEHGDGTVKPWEKVTLVEKEDQPTPNIEADEFECEFCQCVFDIEDSIKLPSGHLICAQCEAKQPKLPAIGSRIRLRHDVDRYPHFVAKEGSYGTVVAVEMDAKGWGNIDVKMDDFLESCLEWDNCVCWNSDMANDPNEPLAEIFAFDCEVLTVIPPQDLPVETVEGRLHDKEWPCGMRVRFKNAVAREGVAVSAGTMATVVWWSPDNAAVKLDRLATMHGDGAVIEWDALKGETIWDDVEDIDWQNEADAWMKTMSELPDKPSPLDEAQQQARLNEQSRQQEYQIENRRRAAVVTELAKEIRAAGFTIKSHTVSAVRFGTAECSDMYFGTFSEGSWARIGINALGAEAIAKGEPKAAVQKLLAVIASK